MPLLINESLIEFGEMLSGWYNEEAHHGLIVSFYTTRRQGRPAKWWRDDLDKYRGDTIWQRTTQDGLTWRRHAEVLAQPRDTTAA